MERAISLCSDDRITCEDLPPQFCDMIAAQNSSSADTAYANSEHPGYPNAAAHAAEASDDAEAAHTAKHYDSIPAAPPAAAGSYANETMDTDPHRASYNIAENEAALIISALEKCSGNVTAAAKLLSMNLRTLYRKIKKHQIDVDLYRHRK